MITKQPLFTNIAHIPLAYQCAIECLGNSGDRTEERLSSLCDHYERAYGITNDRDAQDWRDCATWIASRRYLLGWHPSHV